MFQKENTTFEVKKVNYDDTKEFILNKHYAQRMLSIKWAFGLFSQNNIVGVLTVGKPASPSLCKGVCGEEFKDRVWELNRLIVNDDLPKNVLSWFVSRCLKRLKKEDIILVSYADSGASHHGYIYQATNFIYTGATKERTDKYTPENKHSRHYDDRYSYLRKVRTSKYRYIYFTGKSKKKYMNALNYKIQDYPKGDNKKYKLGDRLKTKVINKETGESFFQ